MLDIKNTEKLPISIAMTTCNGEKYLERQLNSFLSQTRMPYELIVCDDVSTDNTVEILEDFAQKAPFSVQIVCNKERLGVLDNFVKAFNLCQSEYIAYSDQDDVWYPKKLETCYKSLNKYNAVLVSHKSEIVDDNLEPIGKFLPYGFPFGCYKEPHFPFRYWGHGHQMVFSRDIVDTINYFHDIGFANIQNNLDQLINIIAGMHGPSVFIKDALIKFRRHGGSVSKAGKVDKKNFTIESKLNIDKKNLEGVIQLLNVIYTHLNATSSDGRLLLPSFKKEEYLNFLNERKHVLEYRMQIINENNIQNRIKGFLSALMNGAYRREKQGGYGIHYVLKDILVMLRLPPYST